MNCCDEYGNCCQGHDCPVRTAKVGRRYPSLAEPLPPITWRHTLKDLAAAMLIVILVMLLAAAAALLVFL